MSLIAILEKFASKLSFQTEEEKAAIHEQIAALGDEAVTDVKTLVHGATDEAETDIADEIAGKPVVAAVDDPLAGYDVAALEAELAKRNAAS